MLTLYKYLTHRIGLYEKENIRFKDEIDVLGLYLDGGFPIKIEPKEGEIINILNFSEFIDEYYNKMAVGLPDVKKPRKKDVMD